MEDPRRATEAGPRGSSGPGPVVVNEPDARTLPGYDHGWRVVLWNDDWHTFDEVILQVQKATGCSLAEATRITLEAHHEGQATAYEGLLERCELVAAILAAIRLTVTVERVGEEE